MLATGGVTHVVRVGDTVRRPVRPFTATVQAYLRHLWGQGIRFVPEPLGYDDQGREVLRYIPGDVPLEPLPSWATTDVVLSELARLIRRLHDASESWAVPDDAVWGSIPGRPVGPLDPLFEVAELVSHQDYCPGNVVFRDERPVALIDFDLARPTTRVADCVNALYWWAPLLDPLDRTPALVDVDIPRRTRLFADAYGLTAEQRREIVPLAVKRASNAHAMMRAAAAADPVFRRWWDEGVKERMPRTERWLGQEGAAINEALIASG
ncbi:MAG: phosphotransferase [Nitriliruptorales bacterium]|nr:phosphotransferase [Nitriliruptorales bacterium]